MSINISKIRSVAPNATAVEDASISRSKPDTLEEARTKVVTKPIHCINSDENGINPFIA